jgi:hypothetical protein
MTLEEYNQKIEVYLPKLLDKCKSNFNSVGRVRPFASVLNIAKILVESLIGDKMPIKNLYEYDMPIILHLQTEADSGRMQLFSVQSIRKNLIKLEELGFIIKMEAIITNDGTNNQSRKSIAIWLNQEWLQPNM